MTAGTLIYGTFVPGLPEPLGQRADHMLGARVEFDTQGRPDQLQFQYVVAGSSVREMRMDYLEALALQSFLRCLQLDVGTPVPDDPRPR